MPGRISVDKPSGVKVEGVDRPLRVAQVVCTDVFAGVERYVSTLSVGLSEIGCEVVVIGGDGSRLEPELRSVGAIWKPGPTAARAAVQLIRSGRFDIVHAHMTKAEAAAAAAAVVNRAPVVATRHFAQRRGSNPPARLIGRGLTRVIARQLAISHYVADRTEGSCVIVPPGTPSRAQIADPAGRDPLVLVTQRLEPEKRTDLALEAWALSGLAEQGWRLAIAGDGQERGLLETLAKTLGVADSCDFLGARADIESLQQRASIQLAPRPDEPFGLAVIEAMAAGLPIVAAAGGGHLETVAKVEGAALYPPDDLRAAGRLLADLAADSQRRSQYGTALWQAHEDLFTIERQVQATLAIYRGLHSA